MLFTKLRPNARAPQRATAQSAGYDLCACLDAPYTLQPGQAYAVPTGLSFDPECDDVGLFIFARSGLGAKHGIALANGVGVVDADYRGEVRVSLRNFSDTPYVVQDGDRIAQLVVLPIRTPAFFEADALSETDRGSGGFGSTGR